MRRCLPCILATLAICASPALRADSAPDIATVPADLRIPDLTNDPPAAGKRVNLNGTLSPNINGFHRNSLIIRNIGGGL